MKKKNKFGSLSLLLQKLSKIPTKGWILFVLTFSIIMVIIILVIVLVEDTPVPIGLTECGQVRGRKSVAADNTEIIEFLYIPYAVPPVGERRWRHSVLMEGDDCWEGTYPAHTDKEIKCVQASYDPPMGQEDCLYLSVKTPNMSGTSLPVIVWIHGGSLAYGYAEDAGYSADTDFTAAVNAVTVNINYRLDLLGFMSHPAIWEDGESYGNFGINDALIALRWVKSNIMNFGGDPNQITIMGESSGGTIVLGLVTAPKSAGLFNRAISMSGAPLWKSTYEDAHTRRPDFLKHLKCDGLSTSAEVKTCLKSADLTLLINSSTTANRGWGFYDFPMSAGLLGESMDYNVKEPFLLPYFPQDIPDESEGRENVELILSNTAQENGFWEIFYGNNVLNTWEEAEELLKKRLTTFQEENPTLLADIPTLLSDIKQQYRFGKETEDWWPQMFWDTLSTDIRATCPMNSLADRLNSSPNVRVYRLYTEHRPSPALDGGARWNAWHGWDTEAMFGFKYYNGKDGGYNVTTEHDWTLADDLRTLVKNFAHGTAKSDEVTPSKSIYLTNGKPCTQYRTSKPQESLCTFWYDNGFQGWGWQN